MRLRNPETVHRCEKRSFDYLFSKLPQDLGEADASMEEFNPTRSTPDIQPFAGSRLTRSAKSAMVT